MGYEVDFIDHSIEVNDQIKDNIIAALYEAAGELTSQVQRNTRVDTGQLKGSWEYVVDESELKATIGSPLQNAIWEEFGTGIQALNGDGRKTAWRYQDAKGEWHETTGKKGTRALYHACETTRPKINAMFESKFKGMK